MSEYTREEILKLIEENGGPEGLDLSGKNLRGIDLSREAIETELEKAQERIAGEIPVWYSEFTESMNLESANLQEAQLFRANLQEAFLVGANLQEADLWFANLQGAYLLGANLQGALLMSANLQEAYLWGANLQEAKLGDANLQEAKLGDANLQGTFFSGVRLDYTDMGRGSLGPAIGEELARDYTGARDAYLRLKQNFDDLGDYSASSWAYQKERQMEKACNAPWRARGIYGQTELGDTSERRAPAWHPRVWWFYIRHNLKWLSDWFVEYLCGLRREPPASASLDAACDSRIRCLLSSLPCCGHQFARCSHVALGPPNLQPGGVHNVTTYAVTGRKTRCGVANYHSGHHRH